MDKLNDVARLAHLLVETESEIEAIEKTLKDKKEDARRIREEALPGAMQELELTEVKLDSCDFVRSDRDASKQK